MLHVSRRTSTVCVKFSTWPDAQNPAYLEDTLRAFDAVGGFLAGRDPRGRRRPGRGGLRPEPQRRHCACRAPPWSDGVQDRSRRRTDPGLTWRYLCRQGGFLTTPRPEERGFRPSRAGVPVSAPTAPGGPGCLTSAPQASPGEPRATARPAARMFLAALMSRSCRARQIGHVQCRVLKDSPASRCPHAEQVLDDGYQRSITTSSCPARSHLYSSWRRNSPHPQSEIARASRRLRTMPDTFRSSITIMPAERTSRVLARCRKSRRASRTFRWARATFALALARFAEPFRRRARRRW